MKSINRRTLLKGMAISSAVAVQETVAGNIRNVFSACMPGRQSPRPAATEPAELPDRAGFDFYVDNRSLLVAATGTEKERTAVFDFQVNPIALSDEPIELRIVPVEAPAGMAYRLDRSRIRLKSSGRWLQCTVTAPPGQAEGTRALFEIEGRRGREVETLRLKVSMITAKPKWSLARSELAVEEQPLKVTAGERIRFRLNLANTGHVQDVFAVRVKAPADWEAELTDEDGAPVSSVRVEPIQGMFQWTYPTPLWLEAKPTGAAERKKTASFTVEAASVTTGEKDELTVNGFYSEPFFSVNDMDGLDPRPHYLQPGAMTRFMLHLKNRNASSRTYTLDVSGLPEGWNAQLSRTSIRVNPAGEAAVPLFIAAPANAALRDRAIITATATDEHDRKAGSVRLAVEVNDVPKIYMLVIDSLDYNYLELNRSGDGPGKEGDWLCPNIRKFMKSGVSFTNAHSGMPAATDMNHTTIVSGATTGTIGAYWVSGYYAGLDEAGDVRVVRPHPAVLRYGKDGKKLLRIFDLVKDRYPHARSFVISNKAWVSHLHEDGQSVKMGITGSRFPVYASAPRRFVLGDPPTDTDPGDRRPVKPKDLTTNLSPLDMLPQVLAGDFHLLKLLFEDVGEHIGRNPGWFPSDRWIADTARQVIREEDPEVLYVNLAAVDDAGHVFGAAWDPDEWKKADGLFYGSRWVSRYSEQARREEILDVVREADVRFGEIVEEIKSRDTLGNSIIVFAADHSMITEGYKNQGYAPIDVAEYLRANGIIAPRHYGMAWSLNHWSAIFDVRDQETLSAIKCALQCMAVDDPLKGKGFHPCIVLDRQGIRTGRDDDNPYLPEAEKKITEPGELYSEYYIGENGLITWPDICVFYRDHYQAATPGDAIRKGVNGLGHRVPILPRHGNRLVGIHGSRMTTHVPIVFSGPGIKQNQEVNGAARLHDILPTICSLLGWDIPESSDGTIRTEVLTDS